MYNRSDNESGEQDERVFGSKVHTYIPDEKEKDTHSRQLDLQPSGLPTRHSIFSAHTHRYTPSHLLLMSM